MQSNQPDRLGPRRNRVGEGDSQMTSASRPLSRSATDPRRFMSEDSWVEISSQPSSSSLSSIGDEIVTTGLNVQDRSDARRRRRLHAMMANNNMHLSPRPSSAAGSSQDEYDESSSESDRVMNSSNEDISHRNNSPLAQDQPKELVDDHEEDEDDTSTALGTGTANTVFTPQPNAFSHPPSSQASRATSTSLPQHDSYFPATASDRLPTARTITPRNLRRPSVSSQRPSHTPYNIISPSHTYQPDHDAALRASLSTLLSCAAAARGLPKRESPPRGITRRGGDTIDTNTLRMVPESELLRADGSAPPPLPSRAPTRPVSSTSTAPSPPASVKAAAAPMPKRKAARESSKDRHSKKTRGPSSSRAAGSLDESTISPTLMTWMVSAGVVILFSAISFSAGFVFGREVGRLEAGGMGAGELAGQSNSCGQELAAQAGGLKRLRWSSGATSVRA